MLYAGNNLDKARELFQRAIKHRPRNQAWPNELEHHHIVPRKICGRCALIETERSAGVK
jgi:hypothetical protein